MTPLYDKNAEGLKAGYGHHIIESLEMRMEFYICPRCSAVVVDWKQHEWWHRDQVKGIQNG
jgi:hypothetical protein